MKTTSKDLFNILLPASRISKVLGDINTILTADSVADVKKRAQNKAELLLIRRAHSNKFIDVDFIRVLSKELFKDTYAWAGSFRRGKGGVISKLKKILADIKSEWDYLLDAGEEMHYRMLAYIYYNLEGINLVPNDGDKLANLITNYFAIKFNLPFIDIIPNKGTVDYKNYKKELKTARSGNIEPFIARIKKSIRRAYMDEHFTELGPSALVIDFEEEDFDD